MGKSLSLCIFSFKGIILVSACNSPDCQFDSLKCKGKVKKINKTQMKYCGKNIMTAKILHLFKEFEMNTNFSKLHLALPKKYFFLSD